MINREYETLLMESKWEGELAGMERGKCSEEGHDLKRTSWTGRKTKDVFVEQM